MTKQLEPTPAPVAAVNEPAAIVIGTSVQGQPIVMTVFGPGGDSAEDVTDAVLVLGGIHGSEPTSVDVARELAAVLKAEPHLARGRTVAIVEVANPDGYARRRRVNANGIDLNRNFPAKNFKRSGRRPGLYYGGAEPASEPETHAILQALERVRPALLISVHSIDDGRRCNNYDGPAEAVARLMERHNGYPAVPTIGYPTPGSLGSYAGNDRQIPMITLELPRNQPGDAAWEANRAALLAAIAGE